MDNHGFGGGGQPCLYSVERRVRKLIEDLNGTVETYDVQRITDGSQEQTAIEEGTEGSHRVRLSFVMPPSVTVTIKQEELSEPEPELGAVVPVRASSSGLSLGGFRGIKDVNMMPRNKGCNLEMLWGDGKDSDPVDMADVLSEEELNQILESFMESADELEGYINRPDDASITVSNEELLHAAIDKHLSQTDVEIPKEREWKSPLFNNLEGDKSNNSAPVGMQPVSVKMEDLSEDEEVHVKMEVLDPDEQTQMPRGLEELQEKYATASSCSFATLTTMSGSGSQNPQPIRQQFIPQRTLPMYAMNQFTYAMTASSQNQILRPANLPAVSALINGSGGAQSLNWAIARYTAGAPATIMSVNPQSARTVIAPSRPSVLISRIPGAHQSTSQMSSSSPFARVRCRKTSPLIARESKDSPAAETHKEEFVSQFAKLQRCDEVGLPDGHSYESWILQEGLHKIRKQGLHRNTGSDSYPFKCPLCDKTYRNPNGIKYHAKYGHGPKCVFTCPICQRDYATRHGLSAHKRSHQLANVAAALESTGQGKSLQKVNTIIIQTQAAPTRPV